MKKLLSLLVAVVMIAGFTAITEASDKAPLVLTDAQMAQIVAGGPAHQAGAADLKGAVADLMPDHVIGDLSIPAHQAGAADLKGGVADLMPDHVRRNL